MVAPTDIKKRVSRIKGQLNGISVMIDENRDCNDIIVQIQAVRASLASLGEKLIENEAICCVEQSQQDPDSQITKLRSLVKDLFKLS